MIAEITIGQAFLPCLNEDFRRRHRIICFEGNRGSAKTRAILTLQMLDALKYPGSSHALWRSSRTRLTGTVLKTLETQVFPAFGLSVPGTAGAMNRTIYKLPNGSSFVPIGLDDIYRGTSAEFSTGYLNEGIEMPQEEEVVALAAALREEKMPPHLHNFYIDTNPGPPGFWLHQRCEDIRPDLRPVPQTREQYDRIQREHNWRDAVDPKERWKLIICGHEDNPGYFDLEAFKFNERGLHYKAETLDVLRGPIRQRWLERMRAAAEGAVFREFEQSSHVVDDFDIPSDWPAFLACDPGYDHPTAIVIGVIAPSGRLYIVAEYVKRETTIEQDATWITQFEKANPFIIRRKLGDPHYIDHRTKHNSGVTIVDHMRKYGHSFELAPAAHNAADLNTQVGWVRDWLTKLLPDKDPKLRVFRSCKMTINAFQSWSFKRSAKGEMTGTVDQYEEAYKDEMDAVRMIVASKPQHEDTGSSIHRRT